MTEQLLEREEIHLTVQQHRRERMPQCVQAHAGPCHTSPRGRPVEGIVQTVRLQGPPVATSEQHIVLRRWPGVQPLPDGLCRVVRQWDDPRPVALPPDHLQRPVDKLMSPPGG